MFNFYFLIMIMIMFMLSIEKSINYAGFERLTLNNGIQAKFQTKISQCKHCNFAKLILRCQITHDAIRGPRHSSLELFHE